MRVAMMSVHSSPMAALGGKEAGGMNVYVRQLSRELGRRGVAVDIFTRSQHPMETHVQTLDAGVRLVNLRAGPAAPYDKNLLLEHMAEFVNRVRCFADGEGLEYDLIHSHYWLSGVAALELRQSWDVPVVHMFHTLGALKNRVARSAEERETLRRIEIERTIAQEADALIAATARDRADVLTHAGAQSANIHTIPCGVDLQRFKLGNLDAARRTLELPPAPHRLVLLVGRIEPLKGIDALIEAIALLYEREPALRGNLSAVVVGGAGEHQFEQWNSEQRRLDALRRQHHVESAIHFAGAQPQARLALYYAAADIVTMPSHYESFGMAALEGMASGRAVVATNAGGPSFIIEDGLNGLLTAPNVPAVLAEKLAQLLGDDAKRAELGCAARRRAEDFGWPNIACEIIDVYQQVLAVGALAS